MQDEDEDALICDLAETYGIYSLESLPLTTVATLAAGLPDDSRIKRKLSGVNHGLEVQLLAALVDQVRSLTYMLADPKTRGDPPSSVYAHLMNVHREQREEKDEIMAFSSPEDFILARQRILKGGV